MNEASVYEDDCMACDYTLATLWIGGGDSTPGAVTEALDLTPTRTQAKEQPSANGRRPSRSNVWQRSTEGVVVSRDSLRHVDRLLSLLEGKDAAISRLIGDGWRIGISVFYSSHHNIGGPRLTPSTIRRLAELGIGIDYEFFFDAAQKNATVGEHEA